MPKIPDLRVLERNSRPTAPEARALSPTNAGLPRVDRDLAPYARVLSEPEALATRGVVRLEPIAHRRGGMCRQAERAKDVRES